MDRLVFSSLIQRAASKYGNNQAIEIVEVGGKTNFADYRSLLEAMQTQVFIVADRDYLADIGMPQVRALFVLDPRKAWRALKQGKKSTDATAMLSHLDAAVANGDTSELKRFLEYLRGRHKALKSPLSPPERQLVLNNIDSLTTQRVYVLRDGEIEDYLPPGVADVKALVEMTTDPNWINRVTDQPRRVELGSIISAVLGITEEHRLALQRGS